MQVLLTKARSTKFLYC